MGDGVKRRGRGRRVGQLSARGRTRPEPVRCTRPSRSSASTARSTRGTGRSSAAAIVPIVAARSRPRSSRSTPPRAWRIEPSNAGCDRPLRRPVRPLARNRHDPASGQRVASGRRAAHRSRPRFITAWFQSPGRSGGSHLAAAAATSSPRSRRARRRTPAERSPCGRSCRPRRRGPKRDGRDRRGRVRTDPRKGRAARRAPTGTRRRVAATIAAGRLVERYGASRVAEPAPRRGARRLATPTRACARRGTVPGTRGTPRPRETPASAAASSRRRGRRTGPSRPPPRVAGSVRSEPSEQRSLRTAIVRRRPPRGVAPDAPRAR